MKKTLLLFPFAILTLLLLYSGSSKAPDEITFKILLDEMIDREQLPQFPDPYYTCKQASSYDRKSVSPDSAGWFANADRSNFIRTEKNNGRIEQVLMDTNGPGVIVRFWITVANYDQKGILRLYFDGESAPRIEGEPFNLISGGGLVGEPMSASVSELTQLDRRGHNLYLPIPYSRHLKVTYESYKVADDGGKPGNEAFYYQINYRTYDGETKIRSFEMSDLVTFSKKLNEVQEKLANRSRGLEQLKLSKVQFNKELTPGSRSKVSLTGKKAVRHLKLKLKAGNIEQALRSTVMSITFDGHKTVWSPVGDFFGTGYQIYSSKTWYQEVGKDGTMECFWIMPFRESCDIEFINLGNQNVEISDASVSTSSWKWQVNTMYFGSSWNQYTLNTEIPRDLNYSTLTGEGVYVGDGVALFDCNPGWWGEGDEKIYVDNETFPSHFGTGTEDYYGYAWCRDAVFSHPFISQPAGFANRFVGNTVNIRYRSLDAIPFRKNLRFDMELLHWTKTIVNFAPVSYWYLKPGGSCKVNPSEEEAAKPVILKRQDIFKPLLADGKMIEGEDLIITKKSNPNSVIVTFTLPLLPRGQILEMRWNNARPEETITTKFISGKSGTYRMTASVSKSQNSGAYQISVNGDEPSKSFNGYSTEFKMELVDLGLHKVIAGDNTVTIKCIDGSLKGENGSMFGLDNLQFDKDEN